jgi:hypothetical protein
VKAGTRRYAVVALVTVGWLGIGSAAQADTVDGVTVPHADLTQGTGTQTVDVTISSGSLVVGRSVQVVVSTTSVATGISASGAGGTCSGSSGGWICVPSGSVWRAGVIQLYVSTATAMPCCGSDPLSVQIVGDGMPIDVYGSIHVGAPLVTSAPTTSAPKPRPTTAAPTTAARASTHSAATVEASTTSASPSASATHTSARPSASPTVKAVVTTSPPATVSSAPAVADTADASSSSAGTTVAEFLAAALLLGAVAGAWIWRSKRRRDPDTSA